MLATDIESQFGVNIIMTIGEILKKARIEKNLRQEQVAQKIGINKSTISLIESEKSLPSYELLKKLAELYGLFTNHLLSLLDEERISKKLNRDAIKYGREKIIKFSNIEPTPGDIIEIDVIEFVPGGKPVDVNTSIYADIVDTIKLPASNFDNKVGLKGFRVRGDSMTGYGIYDGFDVVIDPTKEIANGDLVVIAINEEVTLKEYHHIKDNIVLKSGNPDYPDMTFPIKSNHIKVYGRVVYSNKGKKW